MSMPLAIPLASSCLAVLTDIASDIDESIDHEHLLLDLDRLHPI
jgi:hypothetical protein